MDDATPPFPHSQSQTTSQHPTAPLPASAVLDQELARRECLAKKGNIKTACTELDEYVLLGGLERGAVVGLSAEDEGVGVLIGLQTVARLLVTDASAKAMVVTTSPAAALLPGLRKAIVGQLAAGPEGLHGLQGRVRECLERTAIARVFDVEGLWEVLAELEGAGADGHSGLPRGDQGAEGGRRDGEPSPRGEAQQQQRTEVRDSEDEGSLSSPESPPTQKPSPRPDTTQPYPNRPPSSSTLPDLILITHTSTLLNALFTGRDKQTAHDTMLLLSSHLRTLARSSPSPRNTSTGPLIMLLNSTTSPSPHDHHHHDDNTTDTPILDGRRQRDTKSKIPDPTLRSIFNPPPPPPPTSPTSPTGYDHSVIPAATARNKPSYGLVFSQLLDLHLLCTRVPRTRGGGAAPLKAANRPGSGGGAGAVAGSGEVAYVWVVEVLLDEVGVYELSGSGGASGSGSGLGAETEESSGRGIRRRCREQRWACVDVDGEGRVVDAVL